MARGKTSRRTGRPLRSPSGLDGLSEKSREEAEEAECESARIYEPGLFIPSTEHRRIAPQLADLKPIFRPGVTRSNFPYCDNLNL